MRFVSANSLSFLVLSLLSCDVSGSPLFGFRRGGHSVANVKDSSIDIAQPQPLKTVIKAGPQPQLQPHATLGDSIEEASGDLIAKGALLFPNLTSNLLEDAIKIAFDNPNLAHGM